MLFDTYTPLKIVNKYKLKFKSKPWIRKLLTNFINKKDPILKEECYTYYKRYRNLLSTLMKKSIQAYYDKYFERSWNNIKNNWKRVKSLITLKNVASSVTIVLSLDNGDTSQSLDNGQNSDKSISNFRIFGQSFINKNCHNWRTNHDFDKKLGPVAKLNKKNTTTSKKLTMTSCRQVLMLLSFSKLWSICSHLEAAFWSHGL